MSHISCRICVAHQSSDHIGQSSVSVFRVGQSSVKPIAIGVVLVHSYMRWSRWNSRSDAFRKVAVTVVVVTACSVSAMGCA
jgi:hypothetical protein